MCILFPLHVTHLILSIKLIVFNDWYLVVGNENGYENSNESMKMHRVIKQ